MEQMIGKALKYRGVVVAVFIIAAMLCLLISPGVRVNFNMVDYLPEQAASTIALDVMDSAYDKAVPNLRVMIPNVSLTQALDYKAQIKAVPGVEDVNWLDDQMNTKVPLETQDQKKVADWYVDGHALFSVVVAEEGQKECLDAIRTIIGDAGAMSGNPVDTVSAQSGTGAEIGRMMLIIIPAALLILLLTTTSWAEPFILLFSLGVAIAINMGTNIALGEISFVTNTTAIVLQLACSIDYSIFLLDRFAEMRDKGYDPLEAMAKAVAGSASSVLSSGLTTIIGFAALIIMQFRIGADMGIVLAKGIACSLVTTLVFLPCVTMYCYKLIDKTNHRSFLPSFRGLAKAANRIKSPVAVLVALLLVPCYLAGQNIDFTYGMSAMSSPDSKVARDRNAINDIFGESASFALLVPGGSMGDEIALGTAIKNMPEVSSLMSYAETVGNTIPSQFVPKDVLGMLNSEQYTRMVITARVPPESDETFAFVEKLRGTAQQYYPGQYHFAGEVVNVYDMKDTITGDSVKVNLISIGGIALVLLLTFKSLSLPFILLLTIESSIFINVAVPYFTGESINYIGYLVISSVQLGATVDYAILFANRYIENRGALPPKQAGLQAISDTAGSILTSGGILTMAGLVLGFISTNSLISQLGILLARGAALSALLVIVFLPGMLVWLDPLIQKTTLGLRVMNGDKHQTARQGKRSAYDQKVGRDTTNTAGSKEVHS
ncbi:MAG: MMPL family transporter [Oscillospiraceae bacterium]|nr:MMPL family transporter [Oscillospiraceae bacterium]